MNNSWNFFKSKSRGACILAESTFSNNREVNSVVVTCVSTLIFLIEIVETGSKPLDTIRK